MWLINARTLKLEYFIGSNIPAYAILSHTWEDEEVSFQDMAFPTAAAKKGYIKITETCTRALRHGLEYAWVDTCCINKESSAELTESINSMFQWYQDAARCYAYLSDLHPNVQFQDRLWQCRWFTRGWTLQELIAPKNVQFYNQNWQYIGSKHEFVDMISSITGIDADILSGKYGAEYESVATRMSWAANRTTTRTEDLAYCLMGIFGVNMPLIYGEGSKAFRRLQEEIIKHDNDPTIFAWDRWQNQEIPWSLFSPSPAGFVYAKIDMHSQCIVDPVFSITNKGLRIENLTFVKMSLQKDDSDARITRYFLLLGAMNDGEHAAIYLPLLKVGPNVFVRDGPLLNTAKTNKPYLLHSRPIFDFHIDRSNLEGFVNRRGGWLRTCHFAPHEQLEIVTVEPESHWDETRRLFFSPLFMQRYILAALCNVTIGTLVFEVIVFLNFPSYDLGVPVCKICRRTKHDSLYERLFSSRSADNPTWDDAEDQYPILFSFNNELQVSAADGGATFVMSMHISPDRAVVPGISTTETHSLIMDIERVDVSS